MSRLTASKKTLKLVRGGLGWLQPPCDVSAGVDVSEEKKKQKQQRSKVASRCSRMNV